MENNIIGKWVEISTGHYSMVKMGDGQRSLTAKDFFVDEEGVKGLIIGSAWDGAVGLNVKVDTGRIIQVRLKDVELTDPLNDRIGW